MRPKELVQKQARTFLSVKIIKRFVGGGAQNTFCPLAQGTFATLFPTSLNGVFIFVYLSYLCPSSSPS